MKSEIESIGGDASFRRFYRFKLNKSSKIIVTTKREKYKNLIVYSAINKFLRDRGIYTPRLISKNFKKGFIEIEDFGNKTLFDHLKKSKDKLKLYKKSIDVILKIQKISLNNLTLHKEKIKYGTNKYLTLKYYNRKKLHRESDLFFDWYLSKLVGKKKTLKYKKNIKKELDKIYKKIFFRNIVVVHRDFHVSNIMPNNKKLGIIDTQDSIIGNPFYDLASLIDDVRVKISKKNKEILFNYFFRKSHKLKNDHLFYSYKKEIPIGSNLHFESFSDYYILSAQRLLKILGIFVRLHMRDGKSNYLKYLPNTWHLLEEKLQHPYFFKVRKLLDKAVSKNKRKNILFK